MLSTARLARRIAPLAIACAIAGADTPGLAATATGSFTSRIVIQAECQVVATNILDFGTRGVILANVDVPTTLQVQCTNTTPYTIGLNEGTTSGGTTTTRKMTSGSATIDYKLFSDSAHTTNWGNTSPTDTVSGTGSGSAITHTVYGRVIIQPTPAPATYSDTVTITVTY